MLKSMSIHYKGSKGIVKSNFITSCFAFKSSIPTKTLILGNRNFMLEMWETHLGILHHIVDQKLVNIVSLR